MLWARKKSYWYTSKNTRRRRNKKRRSTKEKFPIVSRNTPWLLRYGSTRTTMMDRLLPMAQFGSTAVTWRLRYESTITLSWLGDNSAISLKMIYDSFKTSPMWLRDFHAFSYQQLRDSSNMNTRRINLIEDPLRKNNLFSGLFGTLIFRLFSKKFEKCWFLSRIFWSIQKSILYCISGPLFWNFGKTSQERRIRRHFGHFRAQEIPSGPSMVTLPSSPDLLWKISDHLKTEAEAPPTPLW